MQVCSGLDLRFRMLGYKKETPADDVNEGVKLVIAFDRCLVELDFRDKSVFFTYVTKC